SGADVYRKAYASKEDTPWQYLGKTPIQKLRLPYGWYRWKFKKPGFEETFRMAPDHFNPYIRRSTLSVSLQKHGTAPKGMVKIQGGKYRHEVTGRDYSNTVEVKDYW